MKKEIFNISILVTLFTGCATVDKALVPVDNTVYKLKTIYKDTHHSIKETYNNTSHNINELKSNIYETPVVNIIFDDDDILVNRDQNFIKWSGSTNYSSIKIIKSYMKKNNISLDENSLKVSDKMNILKEHFFDKLKKEHISKFENKNKKVKFNSFLTDRENIKKIYEYKTKLSISEHDWNMNISKTQKKVAELMLATLFDKPIIKFISYDPYEKELYLLVSSKQNGFKQKIKFEIPKDFAKSIKKNLAYLKPVIYFKFDNNKLELVGASIRYNKRSFLGKFTDSSYFRESSIKMSTDKLSLKEQDVQYTEVVKNITPPSWYFHLEGENIGYGQGKTKDEAKSDAYKNIAQNIKVVVNSSFTTNKKVSGSISSKSLKSDIKVKAQDIAIENSKVIKLEKKDGIWFVAITY